MQALDLSLENTLEPLKYPVYFVNRNLDWFPELINQSDSRLPADLFPTFEKCIEGDEIWAIETYLFLKLRGLDVHLVRHPVPHQICIVPYQSLSIKDRPYRSYVVACRIDGAKPAICEQQTVLNQLCVQDPSCHYLVQWPQTFLIPRKAGRGSQLTHLTFKGTLNNLDSQFRDTNFLQQLQDIGVRLEVTPNIPKCQLFNFWRDYSEADAVLAIRRLARHQFALKPPIKLINAWFAGCPALLGPEPAYRDLRRSHLDYFEVRSPDDVVNALRQLKENPKLYTAMVENGFERAQAFTVDQLCREWRNFLAGPITAGYEQWLQKSGIEKTILRPAQFISRALRHKRNYQATAGSGEKVLGID